MPTQFNHTIVNARDKQASARFLADMLGLPEPRTYGPFHVVDLDNHVEVAYLDSDGAPTPQHYAFLVGESDFDEIYGRIRERGLDHWADPFKKQPGEINHEDGGRGVYWEDPDGHFLEIITRPYGSGG